MEARGVASRSAADRWAAMGTNNAVCRPADLDALVERVPTQHNRQEDRRRRARWCSSMLHAFTASTRNPWSVRLEEGFCPFRIT